MLKASRLQLVVVLALLVAAVVPTLWALSAGSTPADLALNFGTGMAGSLVTFVLITLVVERRSEAEARISREKDTLIEQMGSADNVTALRAVAKLRQRGWLADGSLKGVSFSRANLAGADLSGADLKRTDFSGANLSSANLQQATFYKALLLGADLENADLAGAYCIEANFSSANLTNAQFKGAFLANAVFTGARVAPDQLAAGWSY